MNSPAPRYFCYLGFAAIVIILDQYTKAIALDRLLGQQPVDVLPFLQWALVFNRGAAFGFLNDAGGIQNYIFAVLAILVSVGILVWLWRAVMENTVLAWGLTLVLAGALGNFVDRVRYQYVIDFINLHYHDWYFPAFNLADTAITFGAIFLIMDVLGIGSYRSD